MSWLTKDDIFKHYGKTNVLQWIDREGDCDPEEICACLDIIVEQACSYIEDRLRKCVCVPFPEPVSPTVKLIACQWVGWLICQSRGITNEYGGAQLREAKKCAEMSIEMIKTGDITLEGEPCSVPVIVSKSEQDAHDSKDKCSTGCECGKKGHGCCGIKTY